MVSAWEQWAVANHYVTKHGEDAPLQLAMRADELLERGDLTGSRTFIAIVKKSEELLAAPAGLLN
ncbi:MAG: hypothetical protein K5799_03990 [Erythrobacter sp.]|nr:hypothetical protein [Erythrobacter sp.]